MIKIVFFGTPEYVVPILNKINKSFRTAREKSLIAVVTQPPKPSGRGNKLEYSEVDHWAYKNNVPIIFDLDEVPEADLGIVASYGNIIPKSVLEKFRYGLLNVHPSLLPKFRGASPVQSTIVSGETQTGVTIIKMDEKLDHGPIVSSFKDDVLDSDTNDSLRNRLFEKSADFLVGLIPSYVDGKTNLKTQDHDSAIYCSQINKSDAYINPLHLTKVLRGEDINEKVSLSFIKESEFDVNAEFIERFIRAMREWPVAWTEVKTDKNSKDTKRIKLLESHVEENKLILDKVQLEGKTEVSWEQFKQGYPNYIFEQ